MSEVYSRREALLQIGAGFAFVTAASGAEFTPRALTAHEYATLDALAEWIVPGAHANGSAQFIDFLCHGSDEMKQIFTGGLAWMDDEMRRRADGAEFLKASREQQKALLDLIAYRENMTPELGPGIEFFNWARRLVVDAYYTSAQGIKEVGYVGNTALAKFSVPQEAVDYVMKRAG